jgi:membrane-associated phospholipid phosphatase
MNGRAGVRSTQRNLRWWLCAGAAAALVVLAGAVAARWTAGFDEAVLQRVRPGRIWEPRHAQLAVWPRIIAPTNTMVALLVVAGLSAALRRSWRPLAVAASVIGGIACITLVLKLCVHREDPTLTWSRLGSFPSGHLAACCALFATASLATTGRVRLWSVLVSAVVTGWMAYVMIIVGMHWATDCIGGLLAALVIVSAAGVVMADGRGTPRQPPAPTASPRVSEARQ